MKNKTVDMINGPMLGKILLFALPLALSSILQLAFNAADTIVVGRFAGSQALAAVGSNGSLINLFVNAFMGLSIGANVLVARYKGEGREDKMSRAVHTSVLLSMAGGCLVGILGFIAAPQLLHLMSVPSDVINLSSIYLRIYFIGLPCLMTYNFGAAILRSVGDTKRPLVFLIISGIVNVCLNLVFVIIFKMSVAGVALATIISELISAILVIVTLTKESGPLKLDLHKLSIDSAIFKEILKIGLPAGLQSCVFSLSNIVIQSNINSFGSTIIAGNSAASNVEGFVYIGINAFYQACLTFVSQNFGAKKLKRCDKALFLCSVSGVVVGLILGMGVYIFGSQVLGFYSTDPQVIAAGMIRLKIIVRTYCICGLMDITVGALRGIGHSFIPTCISLTGSCLLRLVWIATIFKINPTIEMLYIVYPVSWIVTYAAQFACYAISKRKLNQQFKNA